jgi:hypothetical protein
MIDHINGNPGDNRIANLRLATDSQNQMNRIASKGRSLPKGVRRNKAGWYMVHIGYQGAAQYLGCFRDSETAHKAYLYAANVLHGDRIAVDPGYEPALDDVRKNGVPLPKVRERVAKLVGASNRISGLESAIEAMRCAEAIRKGGAA